MRLRRCVILLAAGVFCFLWRAQLLFPDARPRVGYKIPDRCPLKGPDSDRALFPENRLVFAGLFWRTYPESDGLVALSSGSRPGRDDSDMELAQWRTSSNVMYLLGEFQISDAVVLLEVQGGSDTKRPKLDVTLFLPNQTERETIFMGGFPDTQVFRDEFGVKQVKTIHEFAAHVGSRLVLTTSKRELAKTLDPTGEKELPSIEENDTVKDLFVQARFVKSPDELVKIAYASQTAAWVHRMVAAQLQRSAPVNDTDRRITEITLASLFNHLSALCGSRLQAYPAIVGAGRHASILHYRTGENATSGYAPIPSDPPTFVLIDAAGEYQGYASDLTRTYVRRDKWSPKMKLIHEMVRKAQQAALDVFAEDVELAKVNEVAFRSLLTSLIEHKFFLPGYDVDKLMREGAYYVFMPHGLGHPVGLDVHDPTPAKYHLSGAQALAAAGYPTVPTPPFVTLSGPHVNHLIFRGFAMTIEPGIYFIPALWKVLREDPSSIGRFVNWDVVVRFEDVGGVRIEDVVMIDHSGQKLIVTR
ncbi:peptidase M24, structural domain-containing protein [Powellomyces hirtus]|nr:peptidase M24, structural domain-containing protein [Powellomyces hirtus]